VLRDYPELRNVSRVTLLQSLRCVRLVLWDESRQRLVSFREARAGVEAEANHSPRRISM
jgi:omega-6 fatty acid desaturase (delta-12 desaturase)